MWPHVYVICNTTVPWNNFHDVDDIQDMKRETFDLKKTRLTCVCSVFLSVGDLLVNCFLMCVGAVLVRLKNPMVAICTNSLTLNNSTFCPHSVFMCFVWISEQT